MYFALGKLGPQVDVNVGNVSKTSHGQQNGQGPFSQLMDSLQWIGSLFYGETPRANGTSQHVSAASAEPVYVRNHAAPEVPGVSDGGICFAKFGKLCRLSPKLKTNLKALQQTQQHSFTGK